MRKPWRSCLLALALPALLCFLFILSGCNAKPVAVAGPDRQAAVGETLTFDGSQSHDPDGQIEEHSWSFGDAKRAQGAVVTHAYASTGRYTVELLVVDNGGAMGLGPATDTDTLVVSVGTGLQEFAGTGVVIESLAQAKALAPPVPTLKAGLFNRTTASRPFLRKFSPLSKAATQGFLDDNVSFFLIAWEPSVDPGVEGYSIHFLGSGTQYDDTIWSSFDEHPEDPLFDPEDPRAFLDLGAELADYAIAPGTYYFRMFTMNAQRDEMIRTAPFAVSIGMLLDSFPTNLSQVGDTLSWGAVTGAAEYSVQIYDESGTRVFPASGEVVNRITDTQATMPATLPDSFYNWYVDAYAISGSGATAEITRAGSGFSLPCGIAAARQPTRCQ